MLSILLPTSEPFRGVPALIGPENEWFKLSGASTMAAFKRDEGKAGIRDQLVAVQLDRPTSLSSPAHYQNKHQLELGRSIQCADKCSIQIVNRIEKTYRLKKSQSPRLRLTLEWKMRTTLNLAKNDPLRQRFPRGHYRPYRNIKKKCVKFIVLFTSASERKDKARHLWKNNFKMTLNYSPI